MSEAAAKAWSERVQEHAGEPPRSLLDEKGRLSDYQVHKWLLRVEEVGPSDEAVLDLIAIVRAAMRERDWWHGHFVAFVVISAVLAFGMVVEILWR
jgi:hypothetical protein